MRFSELMRVVAGRGVEVSVVRTWGGTRDPEISRVCGDSRQVRAGDLFVVRGRTLDEQGRYIFEALNKGAVAIVGEMVIDLEGTASAEVDRVNLALALLAHEVGGNPTRGMKMIGVTGTKGKTTVAYLMRSVLKAAGFTVGMVGTVEIDDGKSVVPAEMTTPGVVELVELFGRMKANGVTHCVMEVSSHALHQERVAGIDFDVAMFTNLTGDHLDYHGTMEAYGAAKRRLFEGLKEGATAVVNVDDAWGEKMVEGCKGRVVRYCVHMGLETKLELATAKRHGNGWSGLITHMGSDGMSINLADPDAARGVWQPMYKMTTPLVGRHNAYNLTCVVAAAHSLGMPDAEFMQGIRALPTATGAPGRLEAVIPLEIRREEMPFQVFVDYAHTHDALENVLNALRATMREGRLICVFGCGGDRDRTKRPKMGAVAERLADVVIVTSDNPRTENPEAIIQEVCAGFSEGWKDKGKIAVEADRRAAIQRAIGAAKKGDVVLIAGKGHENYQIIGTTKTHFDDVEEAEAAIRVKNAIET